MEIYYYNIHMFEVPGRAAAAEQRLKAAGWNDRIAAAARFRMEADKRRCLCAGLALLDALEERGVRPSALLKTQDGKNFIEKDPGIHFNLSHSGNYAVCAVSEQEVGIDIQEIRDPGESLVKYCCTENERKRILESSHPAAVFTVVWSWKEAFMKMTGQGLRIAPKEIEVLLPPDAEEEIRRAMERSSAKAGDGAGAEKLSGKLPLRKSRAELRPDGKEMSGFFREMNLYEAILGDLPVCVCEGKLICQA